MTNNELHQQSTNSNSFPSYSQSGGRQAKAADKQKYVGLEGRPEAGHQPGGVHPNFEREERTESRGGREKLQASLRGESEGEGRLVLSAVEGEHLDSVSAYVRASPGQCFSGSPGISWSL